MQAKAPASGGGVTYATITEIFGDMPQAKAIAIIETNATIEDLEVAAAFLAGESDVMGEMERPLAGVAPVVYDDRDVGRIRRRRRLAASPVIDVVAGTFDHDPLPNG